MGPISVTDYSPNGWAGSTWTAFTDAVSHAVLSVQYALEQTSFVPINSMTLPHKSPLRALEATCHSRLL
jgi:3-deoxy-D-manno-oct-2-ulosonic acid (Kdo) hydroxylase